MARYIDADKLKERLEDFSRWCCDGRKEGVDFVLDCPLPAMLDEDVVPKSEVEELQTENEELQAKVAKLRKENIELLVSKETDIHISMEKLVKVRTEHPIFKAIEEKVAREIFVEFEEYLSEKKFGTFYYNYLKDLIAELKKKYTEGENEKH